MSDAVQSEQDAIMAKDWVRAPLDIPPLPVQEPTIGTVNDQLTALDTEVQAEATTALRAGLLTESLTTSRGEEWEEVCLSEVSSPLAGPAFKASVFASTPVGPRLLRGINLGRSGTRWNDGDTMFWPEAESGAFQKYALEPGDVCIAMDRPFTRDRVLRCGLISNADLPALLVQRVTRLRAKLSRVMPEFLTFVVQSPSMAERLAGRQTPGGYAPHISGRDISEFTFALPPLSVQERIVEVIGAVDEQAAALEVEADILLRVRNAALGDILSRGGEGWLSAPLSETGTLTRGRRFVKSDYVESGLGCIHYGQIYTDYGASTTRTVTYLPESFRRSMRLAQPGDVVIAGTSENVEDVGRAVAWLGDDDVAIHDDCFIIRHDLDPKFVSYFFASPLFQHRKRQFTSETKVVRISAANLEKIVMPVPPRDEQERISGMADAVDAQVGALRAEAERLRQARVALLSGLLDRTIDIESAELEV